jgi:hypothetical protein
VTGYMREPRPDPNNDPPQQQPHHVRPRPKKRSSLTGARDNKAIIQAR